MMQQTPTTTTTATATETSPPTRTAALLSKTLILLPTASSPPSFSGPHFTTNLSDKNWSSSLAFVLFLPQNENEPGVNFTNILRADFLYVSVLRSFSLITVWLCYIFAERILAQKLPVKCWWNWLQFAFCSTFFDEAHQKNNIVFVLTILLSSLSLLLCAQSVPSFIVSVAETNSPNAMLRPQQQQQRKSTTTTTATTTVATKARH